jgi:hypothetical protein
MDQAQFPALITWSAFSLALTRKIREALDS